MTRVSLAGAGRAGWIRGKQHTPMNPIVRKVSSYKSVGFRPGLSLRIELENLSEELSRPDCKLTISQILREGVTVYWPYIRAYMRARAMKSSIPPRTVANIVDSGIRAYQLGLSPAEIDQALGQAIEMKRPR